MKSLLAFSILAFTGRVASKCPSGTVQGLNDEDCYHFNAVPAMWLKAEEDCIRRRGHLASVSSTMTNAMLRQISSLACANEFWLGGSWDTEIARQWSWTDGRRFSYKNWAAGQPINQEYYCTALDASSGRWYSRACDTSKPYICKVPPANGAVATTTTASSCPACPTNACTSSSTTSSGTYTTPTLRTTTSTTNTPITGSPISGRCRDGWDYVAAARGKCLRVLNSLDTWSNMWAECKRLGGDLVSIPDNATNYAIRDYAYNQVGIADDSFSWFAIGLYTPTIGGPWKWTDGTAVTYTNFEVGWEDGSNPNVTFLGAFGVNFNEYGLRNARWEDDEEGDAVPWNGICQSDPL